jgi:20S proteasome alpha/beta subunit
MSAIVPNRSSIVNSYFLSAQACGMLPYRKPQVVKRPIIRRLDVEKSMTVAAGAWCTDGIIICADTEHTEGNSKFQKTKIWGSGDYLLVTGAGAASYMKMAYDKIAHRVERSRPDNPQVARAVIEKLIRRMHEEHIYPLHQVNYPYANDVSVGLIVAIRCTNGELALVKTELTTSSLVEDYEAVGTGREIFKYWAKYFFSGYFDMDLGSYLAMFMAREAKDSASGVGGQTLVKKMAKEVTTPKVF